jgi:ubiquinone/menaquinone biosynthesis C-methylase UbiE
MYAPDYDWCTQIRDVFPSAVITGVDVSASAIAFANKQYSNVPNMQFRYWLRDPIHIHHTCSNANVDVDGLPFVDSTVDVIISITAVHWMNIPKVMREVQRVLRPGGVLVLTSSR